ncbi:conserved hypothetical membrane spanning protein [Azorhizobium caulinodans ORS 571]|uniref:Conserved hypothetical membrane spanning protein n=2 Tax=Azorhizobium caulinodans TaxID=7 RepID=A8IBS8_AZOC5|nr:conserved hypothetical membrane spanning protein [Azorhizobium caulinodans ORS 571]
MSPPHQGTTIRRHLFFVAGYDPMTADAHHGIFTRELARFADVWGIKARVDSVPRAKRTGATWTARSEGPGWSTETNFEILAWDDLVRRDMNRSRWSHLGGTIRALADMIGSGTLFRYFGTSHRYGIFFCLTYLTLAAIWAVAVGLGFAATAYARPVVSDALIGSFYAFNGQTGKWVAVAAGVATTLIGGFGLMKLLNKRFRLRQSLDLAEFSVDFAHDRHPEIKERITAFADRVHAVMAFGGVDEIIIAGHSLGAMHAISLVARALRDDPNFGTKIPIRILTLGSTIAKFALHPAADRLRGATRTVSKATAVGWTEYQARDDIVSFYKVDPVTLGRISDGDPNRRPLVRRVAIRSMLTPKTYARFRTDVMRLHCQFFLANDRRAPYDFYAFVCAPVPYDTLVGSPEGPLSVLAEDGSLLAPPPVTQQKGA